MKPFSIAALQLDLNYSKNFDIVVEKTYEACKRYPWVQMIVLSELAVGGSSRSLEFSLEKQLPKFQEIAKELNVWYVPGSFYDHVNDEVIVRVEKDRLEVGKLMRSVCLLLLRHMRGWNFSKVADEDVLDLDLQPRVAV